MIPEEVIKKAKPLFLDESGSLILGKGNSLFRRIEKGRLQFLCRVPVSIINQLLGLSRLIERLLRLGFGTGICFRGIYFFTHNNKIYSFDPKQKQLCSEFAFLSGHGPLRFTVIENISGFEDGLYFGDYYDNPKRNPINIYKRDERGAWIIVFRFPPNQINHIHSLIADHYRSCVWILTGDFEQSAAIWKAENSFNDVNPIVVGQQTYRACIAFPTVKGILYATDSQIIKNSIRLLTKNDNFWESNKLLDINGPCIYGCDLRNYYIFSTATEPEMVEKLNIFSIFSRTSGHGIIKNESFVLAIRKKDFKARILFSKKKDFLPYRLFQFGAIIFPQGQSLDNQLFCYSIGNVGNDLSLEVYDLDLYFDNLTMKLN